MEPYPGSLTVHGLSGRLPEEVDSLRDSGILSTAHDAATANGDCDTGKFDGWDPMLQ